jgi:glycosyl transferase family 61
MASRLPSPLTPLFPPLKAAYTQATRAISPLSRRLSRHLPSGHLKLADESIADGGGQVWVTRPEEQVRRDLPTGEPPRHPRFVKDAEMVSPRMVVAELPRGRVLGPHRVIIDGRGRMIEELTGVYWGTKRWSEHDVFWHPFPGPPLEVEGSLGVVAGRGDLNWYHFLLDIVPRLALFEQPGVPAPDRWYLPLAHDWQRETLEIMGVLPAENVIDADAEPHVRAERLLAPSLPDFEASAPWTVDFVRSRMMPRELERVPGRRIYLTRGQRRNNRIVRNEPEVVEMLAERGFEVVDTATLTVAEEIRTFAEAEWIVAPHGAALTNILFSSPGASVIELFAPDYVTPSYWKLADCVPGLGYRYLLGTGRGPRSGNMNGVMNDITIELGALERMLDTLPAELVPAAARAHR